MLYAFGSNGSGQLGISNNDDTSFPRACLFENPIENIGGIRQIVAGGNHTLVLLESGELYFAGSNTDGRAGLAALGKTTDRFQKVDLGSLSSVRIKLCSALWQASVIVTMEDEVYTFGTGPKGELGTGEAVSSEPQKLPNFPPNSEGIDDMASGVSHTVVVLPNGDAWGWGNGRKGQLGQPAGIVQIPRKIQGLNFRVVRVVCGREFTYLVGGPEEGHHTVLGLDKWKIKSNIPPNVLHWSNVGASWGSLFVLIKSGRIVSWGRNDHGQLAPPGLPEIIQMAVGSEHVLALTTDRKVLSWGWGEHGNCGPNINELKDVKDQWNEIVPIQGVIQGLAAGCATSFIWT
jgi:protein ATS1